MHERAEQLDCYLDGQLDDSQRRSFEAAMADDPVLAAEVELQRRINRSLGIVFAAPDVGFIPPWEGQPNTPVGPACNGATTSVIGRFDAGPADHRVDDRRPRHGARAAAVAAALTLAVVGIWLARGVLRPTTPVGPYGEHQTLGGFYARTVDAGFEPQWVCADDEEFRSTFDDHYRQPLLLAGLPDDVRSLGLSYLYGLSPRTTALLTRVRGEPVIVFIDEMRNDPGVAAIDARGSNVFRRPLGRVVLYELTPHDEPQLLSRFYDPDR